MPQHRPRDIAVFELTHADFPREGAVRFVEDVLRRDFDSRPQVFACEEEVEGWRGDDDFCVWAAGGGVEVGDDGFDGVDCAVPGVVVRLVVNGEMLRGFEEGM